jgi:outer membrane receptor protein involved in Fe transport
MNLMSGSNPVFGLNTLGGALSIQTRNGFNFEGHEFEAYTGSFGRDSGTITSGGNNGTFGYFVTGAITKEDGWRDYSPSRVEQFFSTLSYRGEDTTLDLSLMNIDSDLNGNGASPVELVAEDREAVFTHPDNTQNDLQMVSLNGSHWINDDTLLSGNAYYRSSDRSTFNGDGSELEAYDTPAGLVLAEEDEIEEFEEGDIDLDDLLEDSIEGAEALGFEEDDFVALNNTSETEQDSYGLSFQMTFLNDLFGKENQLIIGASYDRSDVEYTSGAEIAQFTDTRGTNGTGEEIDEAEVDGQIDTKTWSLFFTDTISLTDQLAMTVAGRYNRIEIDIEGTSMGGEQDLNEDDETHVFTRFNPSLGFTYAFNDNLTAYTNYSESNRAPSPSELTCAKHDDEDRDDISCALPNSFLADPPLEDVVARTIEAGLRGATGPVNWNANVYYTQLKDDLFFFPAVEADEDDLDPRLNTGVFDNIDETARLGLELSLFGEADKLDWFASYSYVKATFEDTFDYARADEDDVETFTVEDGNRMPGIPAHNIKVGADYAFTPSFTLGLVANYHSSQYLRGDEANEDDKLGSYTVVNLHSRYKLNDNVEFFAKVDNLFDREYETFGLYGEPDEAPGLDLENPRFVGAGAPRAGWIGIKVSM